MEIYQRRMLQSQITDIRIHSCPLHLRLLGLDYSYQHFHSAISSGLQLLLKRIHALGQLPIFQEPAHRPRNCHLMAHPQPVSYPTVRYRGPLPDQRCHQFRFGLPFSSAPPLDHDLPLPAKPPLGSKLFCGFEALAASTSLASHRPPA